MHELVARVLESGPDPAAWRRVALDGLADLVGGQVGLTTDMRMSPGGEPQHVDPLDRGWNSESVRRRYYEYVTSGEVAADPAGVALIAAQRRARHVCRTRRELVDDATWYGAPSVSEARRMGDVDDFILTSVALGPEAPGSGALHGFVVYRAWADRPFEPRHRRAVKLFHLELARAARARARARAEASAAAASRSSVAPRLSPRLRQTLELLLTPLTLKEIAARLGLSRHTVNDYQKVLYARFNVTSRMELSQHPDARPAAAAGQATPAAEPVLRLPAGLVGPAAVG